MHARFAAAVARRMTFPLVSVVALLLTSAPGTARQTPPQAPVFRGTANLVLVDAYPQRDGRVVEGLTAADFDILEDGKPQKVETFEFVRVEPGPSENMRRDPNNVREMYALAADPHNRVFVAYLDTLHTTVEGSHAIRAPLIDLLNRVVGPDDLFGVITPAMRPKDLTLGRRLLSVEEQLTKYWYWGERDRITPGSDPVETALYDCFHKKIVRVGNSIEVIDWLVADGPATRFFDDILVERRREDRTLAALEDLLSHLAGIREARTIVMAISNGWVLDGRNEPLADEPFRPQPDIRAGDAVRQLPGPAGQRGDFALCLTELKRIAQLDNAQQFKQLTIQANRTNVSFYPVAAGGLAVFDAGLGERIWSNPNAPAGTTMLGRNADRVRGRVDALRTLAENTDGIAIVNTNDLSAGIRRIVDDVSAYYLLGFYSTNPKPDGKYRRLEVKLKRPGLTIHARRGYVAASENARSVGAPAPSAVVPSGLDDALRALARLGSSPEIFTYTVVRSGELTIVAEIPSERATQWLQGGDVQAVITGPGGEPAGNITARVEAGARAALIRVPLAAGMPGPWRVGVKMTGSAGSLEERTTVDAIASGPLLGPPIVFRAAPGPRSALRPVADFQFQRTERVHVEWPILKPLDQRQARLLSRTGQPLAVAVTVTESTGAAANGGGNAVSAASAGPVALSADVNLAPLGAGDYVIEVTAGAGTETQRTLIAIRVGR